jgi:hypothetical protein
MKRSSMLSMTMMILGIALRQLPSFKHQQKPNRLVRSAAPQFVTWAIFVFRNASGTHNGAM